MCECVSLSDGCELQLLCVLSVMEIDAMGTYNSSKAVYEECFKVRSSYERGSLVACYVTRFEMHQWDTSWAIKGEVFLNS